VSGDLILRGGLVVDGTGASPRRADVTIRAGRIATVGTATDTAGTRTIDVSGLVVAPGFIDVHTHYDAQVLWDPLLGASTQYGVTTIVMGNCGIGVAPLATDAESYLVQLLARVEGMPVTALEEGLRWDWKSFGDYLDALDVSLGTNVISLVGHSPLRYSVMGSDAYERAATDDEIASMQALLDEALAAGAWGFSSSAAGTHNDMAGRPAPSRLATRGEYEALADVVGTYPFGIIGMSPESKLRGLTDDDRSLLQMLSLRGGASVNWNPLVHAASIPDLWRVNLSASEEAVATGARVFAVYNPSSTGGNRVDLDTCFLFAAFPHWAPVASMPVAQKVAAFSDPATRALLADDLEHDSSMGLLTAKLRTMWNILRVTEVFTVENEPYLGRLVGDIASETGRTPLDTMLDIAVTDDLRTVFMQEDVRTEDDEAHDAFVAMAHSPYVMFGGTDAGAHLDMLANESLPARTLQWRVHEQGSLKVEDAVRGYTGALADAIGLRDRGRLVPGMVGDVVVFDVDRIGAGDAHVVHDLPGGGGRLMTEADGIELTVVAGEVVFEGRQHSGALPGRLLRSGASV
jgi:N-acyl-D-aspartate/D-glutamate deacylase